MTRIRFPHDWAAQLGVAVAIVVALVIFGVAYRSTCELRKTEGLLKRLGEVAETGRRWK